MTGPASFQTAQTVLTRAIGDRVFPCASVEVGRAAGPIWRRALGRLTYAEDAAAATDDTIFDLASLTKVLATATICLELVATQRLTIEVLVRRLIPEWHGADRSSVTVRDLLEHCSGLPAYRPYFLSMRGREAYQPAICAEPLEYPPHRRSIYSDLGFILLGFIVEDLGGPLDSQFDRWWRRIGSEAPLGFNPPLEWRDRIAPTEQDAWRNRLLTGEVHDENAAALDGVAAHAGLFGTATAVGVCARWWLRLLRGERDPVTGIPTALAERFVKRSAVPHSSRALGWDTMVPTSSCGTRLSRRAVGHTGFAGTSLWIDPELDLYVVLLTNRVHPTRDREGIRDVRRSFHDAVVTDLQEP